jgi:cytochrome P450
MEHNIGFMRYGEEWRYHRKICQEIFRKKAVKDYHSIILQKVHAMLYGLLKSPEKFQEHNKMCATIKFYFFLSSDYHNAGYLSQFQ